ncbi:hypothetical protein BH09PSE1_BH09PSE1_05680 [soil metagenome]
MTIDSAVAHYGLLAIFFGAGTEGEAAAVAGGLVAHRGLIPLWQVALAVYAGSLVAGQVLFLVARSARDSGWMRRLTARSAYRTVTKALERRPVSFILTYRFIFGVRTLTPLILGSSQVSGARFAALNALAAALWSVVFTGLGYGFGKGVERLFGHLPSVHHMILIGVAAVIVVAAAFGARRIFLARTRERDLIG